MRFRYLVYIYLVFTFHLRAAGSPQVVPQAPTQLEVFEFAWDFVLLRWQDNADNEDIFIIERHIEGEEYAPHDTNSANDNIYPDTQVEPNTTYYYRIVAENTDGQSNYSNEVVVTTLNLPNTPPEAPSALSGEFNGTDANILSWQDNSTNELFFRIYRSNDGLVFSLHDSVDMDVNYFSDSEIESFRSYYYFVEATNNYGTSDHSDTIRIDVSEIILQGNPVLSLLKVTSTEVQLSWNNTGSNTNFILVRAAATDTVRHIFEDNYFFNDSALKPNTPYQYILGAFSNGTDTSYSNIIQTLTLPWFTDKRINDSLILFYIFGHIISDSILDNSWYKDPLNLHVEDTSLIEKTRTDFLEINNNSLLYAPGTIKIIEACKRTDELTLECWLKLSGNIGTSPAKILSLENEEAVAFSLSCIKAGATDDKYRFFTNLTTVSTDQLGNPDLTHEETYDPGILLHVSYTHNRSGNEILYINGNMVAEGFRPPKYDNWARQMTMVVGNDIRKETPWTGDIYMASLYNRALSSEEIMQNYLASPFADSIYILNSKEYSIHAYPNPANQILNVEFIAENEKSDVTEIYRLTISDINGIIVYQKVISEFLVNHTLELNITGLRSGIYTLTLTDTTSTIDEKKILILD